MIDLRQVYVRQLRGTPLGNAARALWHLDWRRGVRLPKRTFQSIKAAADRKGAGLVPGARLTMQEIRAFTYRGSYVARYYWMRLKPAFRWMAESRETSNFTYDLTERNEAYLAECLTVVTGCPSAELAAYIGEIHADDVLRQAVIAQVAAHGRNGGYDPVARFGRRVGWYALVRALKPRVVVETGVEKGLGAMVLCAALLRNAAEGSPGRYCGTDIDPAAGLLLCEPYRSMGDILYGDSIESLRTLTPPLDLFINDRDHSVEYEAREYRCIAPKLSVTAIF